ncbi:hypothetical protein YC2023_058901 [Brassica napus]
MSMKVHPYDGTKSLYTAGPFPFQIKEFIVDLNDKKLLVLHRQFATYKIFFYFGALKVKDVLSVMENHGLETKESSLVVQ